MGKNLQIVDFKLFVCSAASVKSGADIQRNVAIHLLLPL